MPCVVGLLGFDLETVVVTDDIVLVEDRVETPSSLGTLGLETATASTAREGHRNSTFRDVGGHEDGCFGMVVDHGRLEEGEQGLG